MVSEWVTWTCELGIEVLQQEADGIVMERTSRVMQTAAAMEKKGKLVLPLVSTLWTDVGWVSLVVGEAADLHAEPWVV